jgi:chromosome segregation ATPase
METKKTISRLIARLDDLEKLSGEIKRDLYESAAVDFVTADHKKQFEELKSQIAAAQQQLSDVNAQVAQAKAKLNSLDTETKARQQKLATLNQQCREFDSRLANLRKSLEAA